MATTIEIPATLSKDEILRYSRHLIMPEVGTLGLVDFDVVDYTNLQRQIIH
jgi:molybdopterin/thiamine biosynthesis adenylyltransferase